MTQCTAAAVLAAISLAPFVEAADTRPEPTQEARQAARQFGDALLGGRASALRPVLPGRGKVHLSLSLLGPEEGAFGAGQVEALFRNFLESGSVRSFEVLRVEAEGKTSAFVHARLTVVDRRGQRAGTRMHLAFETEGERWVLREIKETAE